MILIDMAGEWLDHQSFGMGQVIEVLDPWVTTLVMRALSQAANHVDTQLKHTKTGDSKQ